jgi:hypothetical protein
MCGFEIRDPACLLVFLPRTEARLIGDSRYRERFPAETRPSNVRGIRGKKSDGYLVYHEAGVHWLAKYVNSWVL